MNSIKITFIVDGVKTTVLGDKNKTVLDTAIENDIDESFEPLLFGIDMNLEIINNINDLKGKKMILLDGHHRYEYLKRNNIDKSVEIVLISTKDVQILSYPSYLLIEQKKFLEILENYNFSNKASSKFFVSLDDVKFFNNEIENIYELYAFKNLCFRNEYISSVNHDNQLNDKIIIHFTPIQVSEIVESDTLFPPKSTWITPRL